jgi:hypothetical protein
MIPSYEKYVLLELKGIYSYYGASDTAFTLSFEESFNFYRCPRASMRESTLLQYTKLPSWKNKLSSPLTRVEERYLSASSRRF